MDPTLEEKQNDPPQQKDSGEGAIGQGINVINNLAGRGIPNPLGRIGSRIAIQGSQKAATAFLGATASIWAPIAIALIAVLFFTIMIVGFAGAPPSENTLPTEAITPIQTAP